MREISRLASALLLLAFIQGCAGFNDRQRAPEPTGIVINAIVIRNELPIAVSDVMFLAPATGNFAGCGIILANSECRIEIEPIDYYANPLVISWKEHGQPQRTGEFVVRVPEHMAPHLPVTLKAIIFARGQAGAKFAQ